MPAGFSTGSVCITSILKNVRLQCQLVFLLVLCVSHLEECQASMPAGVSTDAVCTTSRRMSGHCRPKLTLLFAVRQSTLRDMSINFRRNLTEFQKQV